MEPVEQLLPVLRCHAGAAVLDGHRDSVAALAHADADDAAPARVPAGVINEDSGQPVDPLWRRADPGRARTDGGYLDIKILRRSERAEPVGAGGGNGGQVDRLLAGLRR